MIIDIVNDLSWVNCYNSTFFLAHFFRATNDKGISKVMKVVKD
jgi:hypothetical protein